MKTVTDEARAAAAAANGPVNNRLGRTGSDQDYLHVSEGAGAFEGEKKNLLWEESRQALVTQPAAEDSAEPFAEYTSPFIACQFPAIEFLPSWNIRVPAGASFRIFLRVRDGAGEESQWFFVGEGGERRDDDIVIEDEAWGKVLVDYLALRRPATGFQYRVSFFPAEDASAPVEPAELHRVFVHYSGPGAHPRENGSHPVDAAIKVNVPYRSQLDVEKEELRHIVCCPTCVAMVLESRGINRPTLEICHDVFCSRHKIHGIWPRASQAAFQHGLKSWVHRFRDMAEVAAWLKTDRPIIASIRVQEGELRGARYPKSNGHLIVITGITASGKVLVNDPYSAGPGGHEIEYEMADIETCWLDRGGVAVVVE